MSTVLIQLYAISDILLQNSIVRILIKFFRDIISTLPPLKQLIVCTATFSSKVGDLVKSVVPSVKYISADTSEIEEIGNISNMLIAVKQYVAPVKMDSSSMVAMRKREKLVEVLKKFDFEQCFIFVNYMTLYV